MSSLKMFEFVGSTLLRRSLPSVATARRECLSQRLSWSKCRMYHTRKSHVMSSSTAAEDTKKPEEQNNGILLSDSCVQQLMIVTKGEKDNMLRVVVDGGGCSGFQYRFELDHKAQSNDRVFERSGVKVVIDELSLSFLAGSTVDYYQELIRSSFRIIDNPNSASGCSCGASFALK